jgi:hypothetical protein
MKKGTIALALLLLLLPSVGKAMTGTRPKKGETWRLTISTSRPLTDDEWNDLQSSFIILSNNVAGVNDQKMSGKTLSISLTYKQNTTLAVGHPFPMVSPSLPIPTMSGVVTTLTDAKNITKVA